MMISIYLFFFFKVFIEFVIILAPVVYVLVFFGHKACGILAAHPEIESLPWALESEGLTTRPPGKSQHFYFKYLGNNSINYNNMHHVL